MLPRKDREHEGEEVEDGADWVQDEDDEEAQAGADERGSGPGAEAGAGEDGRLARSKKDGITFKPIKGNAVFWENLRADGTGYTETWHAAYPVTSGTKVGLNIWSWYQPPKRRRG